MFAQQESEFTKRSMHPACHIFFYGLEKREIPELILLGSKMELLKSTECSGCTRDSSMGQARACIVGT
jgi:hypothetical protein